MIGRGTARKHVEFLDKNGKLLMIGRGTARKHVEFLDKNKFGKISASVGFIKKKYVKMHGYVNGKKGFCSVENWRRRVVAYLLLLLQSALQPSVGFGLLYDFIPQSSIFTLLSPGSHFHLL
jgi:hypothetical protein